MTLPRSPGFRRWVAAETASTLGDSVSFFGLGWAATGVGGGTGGLVLTFGSVPLALLMLLGGVSADRWGIRRMMLCCDVAMCGVMLGAAALLWSPAGDGRTGLVVVLCVVSVLSGTAAAMRRPAEGVFARLFVEPEELPRVLATIGSFAQVVRIAGPAVGGLAVASVGLAGSFLADALTFAVVALALAAVRPPRPDRVGPGAGEGALRAIAASVRAARATAGVPAVLSAVTLLAASVLPMVMLSVPLLGHARGWGAGATGAVSAGWVVGSLVVTVVVARRGGLGPAAMRAGPVLGGAGGVVLACASPPGVAVLGTVLVGVGTSLTTTWMIPTFQQLTPTAMLARFQALLQLAQTSATFVMLPLLGLLAGRVDVRVTTVALSGLLLAAVVPLARVPEWERAPVPVG
ncbi:MAG TPA: MFS transporter [Nocardioides sp.]|nr:MFS transporter [Nocardioides sp.]